MNADGSEQRMLVSNASMGEWHSNGKLVIHRGREDTESFLYDLATGEEEKIWPRDNVKLKAKEMRVVSPSSTGDLLIGWAPNPRGTWVFSSDGKFQKHIHGGCEGRFASDGSFIYWVMTAGIFGKATTDGKMLDPLYDIGKTHYGHTYFPRLTKDMKYLIFGSCPNDQHDHNTSDYEIFLMKMDNLKPAWKEPVRLTYDSGTDRWPDAIIQVDETPPDPPIYVEAKSYGQQVKLTWTQATDSETGIAWYRVFRGVQENNADLIAQVKNTFYIDHSTDAKSEYSYHVSSVNGAKMESVKSDSVSVKTGDSKPITPTGLFATPPGNDRIKLTWSPNPELDIKGYHVYRPRSGITRLVSGHKKLNSEILPEPLYIDESLEEGKIYHYRIKAVDNSGNESSFSEVVSCKPQGRLSEGLIALYLFDEGTGTVVHDRSGVKPSTDLEIKDKDRVVWIRDRNGVEFTGSGMIVSNGNAEKLLQKLRSKGQMSIEVWFAPGNLSQNGPARIVSMSANSIQRNFTIGQSGDELSIRLRTTKTSENGMPQLDTTKNVLSGKLTHVLVTYDGSVKKLYINGHLHSEFQELDGDFSNWENYPLIIGNELRDDRTWLGKIFLVAIYHRALSADEALRNYKTDIQGDK
jgi:hypothetical protein